MDDKKIILFGAGEEGIKAFNYLGKDRVAFFVDNDKKKIGTMVQDVLVCSVDEIKKQQIHMPLYISVSHKYIQDIENQLNMLGIENYGLAQALIKKEGFCSNPKIRGLKDKFKGKRCFIIGTGPSLRTEDLELLKNKDEIAFASNKIFKIFNKTSWRPQLYCISDLEVFLFYFDKICSLNFEYEFLVNIMNSKYCDKIDKQQLIGDNKYIFEIYKDEIRDAKTGKWVPNFSEHPDKYIVDGGITVTYAMIQWAYFLGFKEVYLLGVDFNYEDLTGMDSKKGDHFCENYIERGELVNNPKIEESFKAYEVAEKFSREHNFRIYNATRGGKLEVFERVDFDSLF